MTVRNETETVDVEDTEELEPTPYQNQYRRSLEEDDFEENVEDPVDMATPKRKKQGLVDKNATNEADSHDYKKRYSDLKKHYDTKLNEWKQQQELLQAEIAMAEKSKGIPELPKSEEELEEFRTKYPDVYDVVDTISSLKASERVKEVEGRLEELKQKEQEAIIQTAEQELISLHPDFVDLKEDQRFLDWLDSQPTNISDGIYKNNTDTKWAARVIDLFKADTGNVSKTRSNRQSKTAPKKAAEAVTKTKQRRYLDDLQDDTKIWTVAEISRLKPHEFAKVEKEIDKAAKEGRVVNSL
tara:strand:+ start:5347 stop:6240 length:894 start_codon:yes stop_codon:yes gene_type:complete